MANWLNRIDIKNVMQEARKGEISPAKLASFVTVEIDKLIENHHHLTVHLGELEEIKDMFDELSKDEECDEDQFDIALNCLYDWADDEHNCWIATF